MRFWLRRNLHILFCRFIHCFVYVCASEQVYMFGPFRRIYSSFFFLFILHICLLLVLVLWIFSVCVHLFQKQQTEFTFQPQQRQRQQRQQHDQSQPSWTNCKDRFCLCDWEKKDVYQTSKRQLFSFFSPSSCWMGCAYLVKCEFKMLCAENSNWRLNELLVKSMWLSSITLSQCFQPNNV